ncbi:type II toxin-antitoxin system HicA family toxin [Candidatus Kaiserbacteria bacterium]|nr:type II toxin-antitoxin system HicA family toxin [Candidatus Kaiserbacteria bacterium]
MPKPRVMRGKEIVKIFEQFGFRAHAQRGSHIKLRRDIGNGIQNITIPNHKEIDRGTLHAIIAQVSRFVPEHELRKHFFTD